MPLASAKVHLSGKREVPTTLVAKENLWSELRSCHGNKTRDRPHTGHSKVIPTFFFHQSCAHARREPCGQP
eukprot:1134186-Pelagomonas_calceolata.AAC.1